MQRSLVVCSLLALLGLVAGCGPNYPKCNKDSDCKEKEFCVNGMCQMCRDANDCPKGQQCNKGRCETPAATTCTDDAQCPADQSCIDGVCKPCASDDQCGAGGKCNKGRCTRAPATITTGETPPATGPCALEPIYFDFNEDVLSTDATAAVERDADCLKKGGAGRTVTLVGRTDPRGTEEYNLALSDRRAGSVKTHLTRLGVSDAHLKTVAKGELDATGTDESGWAKDRRVDVQW